MADEVDTTTDIEIKDDKDLENIAAEIGEELMEMADAAQMNDLDDALAAYGEAAKRMEAIRIYLSTK